MNVFRRLVRRLAGVDELERLASVTESWKAEMARHASELRVRCEMAEKRLASIGKLFESRDNWVGESRWLRDRIDGHERLLTGFDERLRSDVNLPTRLHDLEQRFFRRLKEVEARLREPQPRPRNLELEHRLDVLDVAIKGVDTRITPIEEDYRTRVALRHDALTKKPRRRTGRR